jgi:hypothetical protein
MARLGDVLRPVSTTEEGLREVGLREREDLERRGAMLRAEHAGKAAGGTSIDWPSSPAEHVEQFGSRLQVLEQRMDSIPRVDSALSQHRQQRQEAKQFGDALRDAEREERRAGSPGADPEPGSDQLTCDRRP